MRKWHNYAGFIYLKNLFIDRIFFWNVITPGTLGLWIYFNEGHIFEVNFSCLTFEGPVLSQNRASLIEEVSWIAYYHFISYSVLKYLISYTILQTRLYMLVFTIIQKQGKRAKLLSADGNEIDVLFVDRRHSGNPSGKTLVSGLIILHCTIWFSMVDYNLFHVDVQEVYQNPMFKHASLM